jgi:isoleucyl-tRNA synthetase
MKQHGADILRMWVVGSNYVEDQSIGPNILKFHAERYRRLRQTFRYLLGALEGFDAKERVEPAQMPEIERWVLHRLAELDAHVRRCVDDFEFGDLCTAVYSFCDSDLSAFYFDVRKDALYCDKPDSLRRRAARTVFDRVFNCLVTWLAPILCFTAEEAWQFRNGRTENEAWTDSVHLRTYPEVPQGWRDEALAAKWSKIRDLRRVVTGALELERANKRIGASLQAHPKIFANGTYIDALAGIDLAEISITSAATLQPGAAPAGAFTLADVPDVGVVVELADGDKCERCWRVLPDVGDHGHDGVCGRCAEALGPRAAAE